MVINNVSEVTRRFIIDSLSVGRSDWSGRLSEDEFLERLYDLSNTPSTDSRMRNAKSDIIQHRVNWNDWDDDWVFYDPRFNILRSSDEDFLKFLCETVHPVVRPDAEEAHALVSEYNGYLASDGYELVAVRHISGKPVFGAQYSGQRAQVFSEPTGWDKVDRQISNAKDQLQTAATEEHFQVVGLLCREVLITVSQEVYEPTRHRTRDGVLPSSTDVGRMLEAFFDSELSGASNEECRAYGKAAFRLALALQHKRSADFRMAAFCLEATMSAVNILALLGNRRGEMA